MDMMNYELCRMSPGCNLKLTSRFYKCIYHGVLGLFWVFSRGFSEQKSVHPYNFSFIFPWFDAKNHETTWRGPILFYFFLSVQAHGNGPG